MQIIGPVNNVKFVRKEVVNLSIEYATVEDCIGGQVKVKAKGDKYLPRPNKQDNSVENSNRYDELVARAVFYNVTGRTLNGLLGQVFQKKPNLELPKEIEDIQHNISGTGLNLTQLAKLATKYTIALGRGGLLVNYPQVDGAVTLDDVTSGKIRPYISFFKSDDIINWRTIRDGANLKFSMIVLKEKYYLEQDDFNSIERTRYIVLKLQDGNYIQEIYESNDNASFELSVVNVMLDSKGSPIKEIQFEFIGATNNDAIPDYPPMYDLASLNIAHYRNSADYEESCYICGQVTPYVSGVSEHWYKEVFKEKPLHLGSRAAIVLPVGGAAGMLQAAANSMPFEAMGHKEKQMAALGAKLVEQRKVQQTATEDTNDEITEGSILSTIADNVSLAFENALKRFEIFTGWDTSKVIFKLNTDFQVSKMSPAARLQLLKEWQSGGICFEEYRQNLKDANVAYMDDDKAQLLIDAEQGVEEQGQGEEQRKENLGV